MGAGVVREANPSLLDGVFTQYYNMGIHNETHPNIA